MRVCVCGDATPGCNPYAIIAAAFQNPHIKLEFVGNHQASMGKEQCNWCKRKCNWCKCNGGARLDVATWRFFQCAEMCRTAVFAIEGMEAASNDVKKKRKNA